MNIETFACDVCGAQKKDANRWWKVYAVASMDPHATAEQAQLTGLLVAAWERVVEGVRLKEIVASSMW